MGWRLEGRIHPVIKLLDLIINKEFNTRLLSNYLWLFLDSERSDECI